MADRGGGWGVGKMSEGSQRYKLSIIKQIKSRDVLYNMVTIVNNIVLQFESCWVNLKSSHYKKKNSVTMYGWRMLTRIIVLIILQYIQISNNYVVHLKLK